MNAYSNKRSGFTLIEAVISSAILVIIMLAISSFTKDTAENINSSMKHINALETGRQALRKIEMALINANELSGVYGSKVTFIADSCTMRSYDPQGDFDSDGITNKNDSDDDNDSHNAALASTADKWKYGYDIFDDDDDNNGSIDVISSIYVENNTLVQATSENGGDWVKKTLSEGINRLTLRYFGLKQDPNCQTIDLGEDGLPGTGDTGENDGMITQAEMMNVSPANGGQSNLNGVFDLKAERDLISSIYIEIGIDLNDDDKEEEILSVEIMPPMLPLKRRL
ncbi:MAG: prepilin-type N-terminal cleavage/methylation domain-containing protein [bacterium]